MLSDLLHRLRSLFRRDVVERELDEEMRFHLEQQVDAYVRDGLSRGTRPFGERGSSSEASSRSERNIATPEGSAS